jgi:protein-S-isoprenylcysteine O-methyltransferase Ste14
MKPKSVAVAALLIIFIWGIFPAIFIWLNRFLNLSVIQFFPMQIVGSFLILAALTVIAYLFSLFKIFGEGTPVPIQPTKKVIDAGFYRYTRNPMYLCHLAVFFGEFLLTGYTILLVYLVLAWLGLHLFVTHWEEPDLKKRLGKPYLEYLQRVPRWF